MIPIVLTELHCILHDSAPFFRLVAFVGIFSIPPKMGLVLVLSQFVIVVFKHSVRVGGSSGIFFVFYPCVFSLLFFWSNAWHAT